MPKRRFPGIQEKMSEYLASIPRFGKMAVGMGFVTSKQLKDALVEQIEDDLANRPHRLIGQIFFEKGQMTHKQIEKVLKKLSAGKEGAALSDF